MKYHTLLKFGLLACLCFTLAACNVFEGLAEEATTTEDLIDEADVLLTKGDAAKAEQALEKALAKDPQNKQVKVKLAIAKVESNNINVASMLELMNELDDLSSGTSGSAAPFAPAEHLTCLPEEAHDRGTNFNPLSLNIFNEFQAKLPVYNRINQLLGDVLPAITATTTYQQVVTSLIQAGLRESQSNQYAQAALLATALGDLSASVVNTFAISGVTYKKIQKGDGNGFYYGFCANDDAIEALCSTLTAANTGTFAIAGRAITALEIRSQAAGDNESQDIAEEAREALDLITDEVEAACEG